MKEKPGVSQTNLRSPKLIDDCRFKIDQKHRQTFQQSQANTCSYRNQSSGVIFTLACGQIDGQNDNGESDKKTWFNIST